MSQAPSERQQQGGNRTRNAVVVRPALAPLLTGPFVAILFMRLRHRERIRGYASVSAVNADRRVGGRCA